MIPRARAGDTEEVDRQRAEAHLRLLAEEELRRPARPGRIRWAAATLGLLGGATALAGFVLGLVTQWSVQPLSLIHI